MRPLGLGQAQGPWWAAQGLGFKFSFSLFSCLSPQMKVVSLS